MLQAVTVIIFVVVWLPPGCRPVLQACACCCFFGPKLVLPSLHLVVRGARRFLFSVFFQIVLSYVRNGNNKKHHHTVHTPSCAPAPKSNNSSSGSSNNDVSMHITLCVRMHMRVSIVPSRLRARTNMRVPHTHHGVYKRNTHA